MIKENNYQFFFSLFRIDSVNEETTTKEEKSMDNKKNTNLRPVLPQELINNEPELVEAYVVRPKEKKFLGRVMTSLANCLPCPRHLKRCDGQRIYLTIKDRFPNGRQELCRFLTDQNFDLSLIEDDKIEIVDVPKNPVRTRDQMKKSSIHWPLHFHPDPRIEALVMGSVLDTIVIDDLTDCMRMLIDFTERFSVGSKIWGCCGGAAAILRKKKTNDRLKLMTVAVTSIDRHPLWHAAMLAIDLVAHGQGGGVWQLLKSEEIKEESPDRKRIKRRNDTGSVLVYPSELRIDEERWNVDEDEKEDNKEDAYLCTGYWIVMVSEPCAMCSMALLHSRVTKVIYGTADQRNGVLGSKALMHTLPGLNHRYEVWSGLLETDCRGALNKCRLID